MINRRRGTLLAIRRSMVRLLRLARKAGGLAKGQCGRLFENIVQVRVMFLGPGQFDSPSPPISAYKPEKAADGRSNP